MLKPRLRILQVGQIIWATIEEIQSVRELLVNYQGDLLRVQNLTSGEFRLGQRIRLEVVATVPLEFRHRPVNIQTPGRIDLEI
jgi:hypothetical protein